MKNGNKGTLIENRIKNLKSKLDHDSFNTWIQHSKERWELANLYLKALGIDIVPVPSDYGMTREEASKTDSVLDVTAFDAIRDRLRVEFKLK